ncbi:outer membrane protein [Methylobacterium organophilum]|uniref:Outer membrane protein beta-barrel domain-containing protein n=1 Tax=Methylobacterium organophilum TaxID=410 RepID=A0ABQ4T4D7_METOR|nr:outer membrane beta-barrel protein [Methylobacterium organophilum]GJE26093.1 hypothetical protein LKMONMHP_0939 [Methylobacterium organophilum]
MRRPALGFLAVLTLPGAAAAADLDYGVLRGPEYEESYASSTIDWSGVYVGGHGGYSSGAFGFRNTFQPIVANMLRSTVVENDMSASTLLQAHTDRQGGSTFGGFAGYNVQFDDIVLGVEVDYTRAGLIGATTDSIRRYMTTPSDGYLTHVNLSGLAGTKIEDYGTIRARAGYALGNFLPFVTGGLAIGRARITDNVAVQTYGYDQAAYKANIGLDASKQTYVNHYGYYSFDQANPAAGTPFNPEFFGRTKTKVVGGVALGTGLEYAITSNVLLRGEYQYVYFNDFDGHKLNLNTVRGGAAVKF